MNVIAFPRQRRPRGFYPVAFTLTCDGKPWRPCGFYILGGQCVRGSHAVVARGAEIVHDPHPSRAGLDVWEDATLLVPIDPAMKGATKG